MLPIELITAGGGFLMGLIGKLFSMKMEKDKFTMQMLAQQHDQMQEVRNAGDEKFKFTRRLIALTVTFMVIVFPAIAHVIWDVPVIYGWTEETSGFLFFEGSKIQHWTLMKGIPITPVHTHLMYLIAGLYFGQKQV